MSLRGFIGIFDLLFYGRFTVSSILDMLWGSCFETCVCFICVVEGNNPEKPAE